MTLVDMNLTYSKQICDMAVGAVFGATGLLYVIWRVCLLILMFYLIYRVTKIFMVRRENKCRK